MKLVIYRNNPIGLNPPCLLGLRNYVGPRYEELHDLPPPIGLINHSWSKVHIAYANALPLLEASISLPWQSQLSKEAMNRLLYSYNEVLSRSMEFLEDIGKNVSLALSPFSNKGAIVDIKGPERLRASIALPLNKLKHNHNRLAYVEAYHTNTRVPGVAFYHYRDGRFQPNALLHAERPAYSLSFELKRILATLFLYCDQVNLKLANLNEKFHGPVRKSIDFKDQETTELFERIGNLPNCGLLDEI